MNRNDIEALLDRYLKGECSPEENERVERWLSDNGNHHSEWQRMNKASRSKWLSGLYTDIRASIAQEERPVIHINKYRRVGRIAAAVAAVFVLLTIFYLERPDPKDLSGAGQLTLLNVPVNQKKQIVLSDGSTIWVNAKSELKYPRQFTGKTREVYLSGEAYFDIQHDASKPFIIHTGKVITRVLGTAFNIKEDSFQHTVVVTVTRGKVSVSNGSRQLGIITPNQQISFNFSSNRHIQSNVNADNAIAWRDTELHFDDITFSDAAARLEQRFKVKISFSNDKIKHCRFTGTSLNGEQLEKILKVICAFNNATYHMNADHSITIDGTGCNE